MGLVGRVEAVEGVGVAVDATELTVTTDELFGGTALVAEGPQDVLR